MPAGAGESAGIGCLARFVNPVLHATVGDLMDTADEMALPGAMLDIDGSQGEGGGQVLRTSLSLSMLSSRPVRLRNIRAGRRKPGLMRQHLTCVLAAARICGAEVDGAVLGSTALAFRPGPIQAGDFRFAIGSAGSTSLVLQTVLPALLMAPARSRLRIAGGTHVPLAPCADFIAQAFLPVLRGMGARIDFRLLRYGFMPDGDGEIDVEIEPQALRPLSLEQRGRLLRLTAAAVVSQLPGGIAERELKELQRHLPEVEVEQPAPVGSGGAGNALVLCARFEQVCEVLTTLGQRGLSAEAVAQQAARDYRQYLAHGAPVGEHLADQLLLPLWLAGGGHFRTGRPSLHLETNAAVLRAFGAQVDLAPDPANPRQWSVRVQRSP